MAYVKLKNLFAIEPIWDPSDRWVYIFELTNENYTSDTVDNIPTEAYNPKVGDVVTLTVYFGGYYFTEPTPEEIENWKNTRFKEPYEIGTAMTLKKVIGSISGNTIKLSDNSYGEYEFKRFGELTNDDYTSYNKYISNIEIDGENYLIKDSSIEEQLTNKVDINSKVIDGQWVNKPIVLSTSTATGTYNLDLSSYLPNDNYKYDVIFNIKVFRNAVGSSYVYFYTNTINTPTEHGYNIVDIGENSRGASNRFIYPIDIDRQVKLVITTNAMLELSLTAIAYRRLGTNE